MTCSLSFIGILIHFYSASMGGSNGSLELFREVAALLPLDKPLLIQVEYSRNLEQKYKVMTLHVYGKKDDNWVLTYTPTPGLNGFKSKTSFSSGIQPKTPTSTKDLEAGKALAMVAKKLHTSGTLSFPLVLSMVDADKYWCFLLERVPRVTGGFISVLVSKGTLKVRIDTGH